MGFHSTLLYYHPRRPPIITGPELASFVERLNALGLTHDRGQNALEAKLGKCIDDDNEPSMWIEPTTDDGMVAVVHDIEWDIDELNVRIADICRILQAQSEPIYRGFIMLGGLVENLQERLGRVGSPENEVDFVPDALNIEIGPIEIGRDGQFRAGWIAVGLSGNGYLFSMDAPSTHHSSRGASWHPGTFATVSRDLAGDAGKSQCPDSKPSRANGKVLAV